MSKKQEFIDYVESRLDFNDASKEVLSYWEAFKQVEEKDKPLFTDNGKLILQFLKDHPETNLWKSRDIAEEMFVSSRTVSGAMRKLVTDGFVEKMGKDPTIYSITDLGKTVEII